MVRMRLMLPALLALASCAATPSPTIQATSPVAQTTSAAPPQRVVAVSDALGHRLDAMLAKGRFTQSSVTR